MKVGSNRCGMHRQDRKYGRYETAFVHKVRTSASGVFFWSLISRLRWRRAIIPIPIRCSTFSVPLPRWGSSTPSSSAQWTIQFGTHAGNDVAAREKQDAKFTPMACISWTSRDNNDSIYPCVNSINNGKICLRQYSDVREHVKSQIQQQLEHVDRGPLHLSARRAEHLRDAAD